MNALTGEGTEAQGWSCGVGGQGGGVDVYICSVSTSSSSLI